jgi:hypothetical protein
LNAELITIAGISRLAKATGIRPDVLERAGSGELSLNRQNLALISKVIRFNEKGEIFVIVGTAAEVDENSAATARIERLVQARRSGPAKRRPSTERQPPSTGSRISLTGEHGCSAIRERPSPLMSWKPQS